MHGLLPGSLKAWRSVWEIAQVPFGSQSQGSDYPSPVQLLILQIQSAQKSQYHRFTFNSEASRLFGVAQDLPLFEPTSLREFESLLAKCSFEFFTRTKTNRYRIAVFVLTFVENVKKQFSSRRASPCSPEGHFAGFSYGDMIWTLML